MFAEYIQRHINDACYQFYAAIHDAKCEAVKEQAGLLIKNKYKDNFVFIVGYKNV